MGARSLFFQYVEDFPGNFCLIRFWNLPQLCQDLDKGFIQILAKLRQIPKADQAEIAREILGKLKNEA